MTTVSTMMIFFCVMADGSRFLSESNRGPRCACTPMVCSLPYSVLFWSAHPDQDPDSCLEGIEFSNPNEAFKAFFATVEDPSIAYIEIDGFTDEQLSKLGVARVRPNPIHIPSKRSYQDREANREWQHEQAMQAGMAFGVVGYNEAMGYD